MLVALRYGEGGGKCEANETTSCLVGWKLSDVSDIRADRLSL